MVHADPCCPALIGARSGLVELAEPLAHVLLTVAGLDVIAELVDARRSSELHGYQ